MNIHNFANTLGILLIFVGILSIFAWIFHVPFILQTVPGMVVMVFNTAVCFTLTGILILLSNNFGYSNKNRALITTISIFIMLLSTLSIAQDFFDYNMGIDHLIVDPAWINDSSLYSGRMANNTSFAFFISSAIALLLPYGQKKWVASLIQFFTFLIILTSFFGFILYGLNIQFINYWYSYNKMAIPTAISFAFLGVAWWLVWAQSHWYKQFYKNREDSKIMVLSAPALLILILTSGFGGVSIITHLSDTLNQSQLSSKMDNNHFMIIIISTLLLMSIGLLLLYWQVAPLAKKAMASQVETNKIKRELLETEERYALAIQGSNIGLWTWEVGSEEAYYSAQFKNLLGYTTDEFPDLLDSFIKILHPDDLPKVSALVKKHLEHHTPYHIEYRLKQKTGEYRWYQAIGETSLEKGTKVMAGSIIDITESKMFDKMKNEFITIVNHELKTPLISIKGAISLLLGRSTQNFAENDKKLLEVSHKKCENLINLINNLLDLERIENGKIDLNLKKINMKLLLSDAVQANEPYVNKCNAELHVDCKENIFVLGDYDRLLQVLTNLISNAAKFTLEHTIISIRLTHNDQFARVLIQDQGNGIPKEIQNKIFGKFVHDSGSNLRKVNGLGVGLMICKAIIDQHHGAISFISEKNKGTTFYFDIPLAS